MSWWKTGTHTAKTGTEGYQCTQTEPKQSETSETHIEIHPTKCLAQTLPKYQGQEIQGTVFRLKESRERIIKYNARSLILKLRK